MGVTQEIDVEKIMERVRENIRTRQAEAVPSETTTPAPNEPIVTDLTALHNGYDIYHIHFTSHRKVFGRVVVWAKNALRQLLSPILEGQLQYNAANARATSRLWDRLEQVREEFEQTTVQMEQRQAVALQTLRAEIDQQQAVALQAVQAAVEGHVRELGQQQAVALQAVQAAVEGHVRELGQQQAATLQALREEVLGHIWELGQQQEAVLQALRGEMAQRQEAALQTLRAEMDQRQEAIMQALRGEMDQRQEAVLQTLHAAVGQVEGLGRRLQMDISQLKANLTVQERRLTMLLEEARKRLPEPYHGEQLQLMDGMAKHMLDGLYLAIEEQFRGSREEIKERFRTYLPILEKAKLGTAEMPILDIGCGRGEWLELLREEGLSARGVDINPVLIELCRERQLDVATGDALGYLRTLPDACLGALTGFHIVEHLPFETLIQLFDETVRVLKPGGLAIFETPNPQNVLVGSCNFYLDPTHGNPLPSPLLRYLAEARGLSPVEILYLHPSMTEPVQESSDVAKRFNEYFYGPMDYAILGWRR